MLISAADMGLQQQQEHQQQAQQQQAQQQQQQQQGQADQKQQAQWQAAGQQGQLHDVQQEGAANEKQQQQHAGSQAAKPTPQPPPNLQLPGEHGPLQTQQEGMFMTEQHNAAVHAKPQPPPRSSACNAPAQPQEPSLPAPITPPNLPRSASSQLLSPASDVPALPTDGMNDAQPSPLEAAAEGAGAGDGPMESEGQPGQAQHGCSPTTTPELALQKPVVQQRHQQQQQPPQSLQGPGRMRALQWQTQRAVEQASKQAAQDLAAGHQAPLVAYSRERRAAAVATWAGILEAALVHANSSPDAAAPGAVTERLEGFQEPRGFAAYVALDRCGECLWNFVRSITKHRQPAAVAAAAAAATAATAGDTQRLTAVQLLEMLAAKARQLTTLYAAGPDSAATADKALLQAAAGCAAAVATTGPAAGVGSSVPDASVGAATAHDEAQVSCPAAQPHLVMHARMLSVRADTLIRLRVMHQSDDI